MTGLTPSPLIDAVAPPPVALASLAVVLGDEQPKAHELEEVVRNDPGLMVRLLAVANSAAYARGAPITDVRRAIVRLGVREACQLALALSSGFLAAPLAQYGGSLWRSSLYTAVVAERLGQVLKIRRAGTLYTAGLLCDVGKLAIEASGRELVPDASASFLEVEHRAVGTDHARLSGELLAAWGLPDDLVDLVTHHHDPRSARQVRLALALHLADAVVRQVVAEGVDALSHEVSPLVARGLGLPSSVLDLAVLRASDFFQSIDEVM